MHADAFLEVCVVSQLQQQTTLKPVGLHYRFRRSLHFPQCMLRMVPCWLPSCEASFDVLVSVRADACAPSVLVDAVVTPAPEAAVGGVVAAPGVPDAAPGEGDLAGGAACAEAVGAAGEVPPTPSPEVPA